MKKASKVAVYSLIVVGVARCSSAGPSQEPAARSSEELRSASSSPTAPPGATEDALPPDYVRLPGGWAHPSCIHKIPAGATVHRADGTVRDRSGKILSQLERCKYPRILLADRAAVGKRPPPDANVPGFSGWIEGTDQDVPEGATTWNWHEVQMTVPQALPSAYHGTAFFFYNALYSPYTHDFLQPVLQWGVSGGPDGMESVGGDYWALVSWSWDAYGIETSNLARVNPGDQIAMQMYLENYQPQQYVCDFGVPAPDGPCSWDFQDVYTWSIAAFDWNSGTLASVTGQTYQPLSRAFPAVFEAHNMNVCPPAWDLLFWNIELYADQNVWPTSEVLQPFVPNDCDTRHFPPNCRPQSSSCGTFGASSSAASNETMLF